MEALHKLIENAPKGVPILLDAKRGDISTTAEAYATAAFDVAHADAITVNAYMGFDSVEPFLKNGGGKGVFVLCKTSNPTSNEFQTLELKSGEALFENVARKCEEWNVSHKNVGVVVGATDVDALRRTRKAAPTVWILAPGVGFQGGDASEAVRAGVRPDGLGMLVPISRGISRAADPGAAALEFRNLLNDARRSAVAPSLPLVAVSNASLKDYQRKFIEFAVKCNVLRFGEFKLKSGRLSPYFFNAGLFNTGAQMLALCQFYAAAIVDSGISFDVIFGPAYKGIPLAAGVAMSLASMNASEVYPFSYNRKEAKDHGEGGILVGSEVKGKKVMLIDDVITAGTAIREAMSIMEKSGAAVSSVCVALDRQEKVTEESSKSAIQEVEAEYGVPVVSIIKLEQLVAYLREQSGHSENLERIMQYRTRYGV